MTEFSDVCPKCGHEVEDLDGFGMLCDLGPGGCGWCSHPNITDGQCGFCGRLMEDRCGASSDDEEAPMPSSQQVPP